MADSPPGLDVLAHRQDGQIGLEEDEDDWEAHEEGVDALDSGVSSSASSEASSSRPSRPRSLDQIVSATTHRLQITSPRSFFKE